MARVSVESARGCGYRSSGRSGVGVYLVGPLTGEPCERLPFPLSVCPCCGEGIRPSRGFRWIEPVGMFPEDADPVCFESPRQNHNHALCPICTPEVAGERAGVIWIGVGHYPTPSHFLSEAAVMGVSRRLSQVPGLFELGSTWVYLAHRRAVMTSRSFGQEIEYSPGVFFAWQPQKMELVVDDLNDIPDRVGTIINRFGSERVEVVRVVRDIDAQLPLL